MLFDTLKVRKLCRNASNTASQIGGVSSGAPWIERPTCHPADEGRGGCAFREVGLRGLSLANVSVDWVCFASPNDARGGVKEAWKAFSSGAPSCRQPESADPEYGGGGGAAHVLYSVARAARALAEGVWMIEGSIAHGVPDDGASALRVVAEVAELVKDYDTALFQSMEMRRVANLLQTTDFVTAVVLPPEPPPTPAPFPTMTVVDLLDGAPALSPPVFLSLLAVVLVAVATAP